MNNREYDNLIQNSYHSNDRQILRSSAEKLGELTEPNIQAILALVYLLKNNRDELVKWQAIRSLGNIAINNYDAIEALIEVITIGRIPSRYLAAESLSKIAEGNELAITSLTNLIYKTEDKVTLNCISNVLGSIALENQNALDALIYLKNKIPDYDARLLIAANINSIIKAHPEAINTWLDIISNETEYQIIYQAGSYLSQVAREDKFVINELKKIKNIKGKEESIVNRRKVAKSVLWEINKTWYKKILSLCGSILLLLALPLFFLFQGIIILLVLIQTKSQPND